MLKSFPMHNHKVIDPVSYMATITFADGEACILKGKAKTTASIMIQSPRVLKVIYEKLGIDSAGEIRKFKEMTYEKWDTANNTAHFSKYSICKIASDEVVFTAECVTHPISA